VNTTTNKIYISNYFGNDVTVIDGASNAITTVSAGTNPGAVAVNLATNKIYVANLNSSNVTVIDGASNTTTTVSAGTNPYALAVNPATNKIYVANSNSSNVTVIDGASNATTTVSTKKTPYAVAVNPITNKIYVANADSFNVTVIDGASNVTTTVSAGTNPYAVAVNAATNKIYVANTGSNNVTVIDGASNATTTVTAGYNPSAVAVNPTTNKIYVANFSTNNLTVIDGATNTTTIVSTGTHPLSVAVNPATNKIYVANYGSSNVTVIDGASNATTTVSVGTTPLAVEVNPVTNKIYVANADSNNVTVIDGASNATTTVSAGTGPRAVAVNPVTNKIYVANSNSANVTVIDGASNATTIVSLGTNPYVVALNPTTNKVYVANLDSANVTVIDGASNATTTVATGTTPLAVEVNPITNKVYVANLDSANVTVIDEQPLQSIDPVTVITPLPGNVSTSSTPTCTFRASSSGPLPVQRILYQVDTRTGQWHDASLSGNSASATLTSLQPGTHILYAMATDGTDATCINTGCGNGAVTGKIAAYVFTSSVQTVSSSVVLNSISVTTPATKLIYSVGDTLDLAGLVVTGRYSDSSTKVETVAAADVTGFNSAVAATAQILTITVGTKTTTYKVQIGAASQGESAGQIQLFSETFSGYGGKTAGMTIIRNDGCKGDVGVTWTTSGTAVAGSDFTGEKTGTIAFANGEKSKTLLFPISQTVSDGKTIILTLSNPTGKAVLGTLVSATLKIQVYMVDTKTKTNKVQTLKALNPTIEVRPSTSSEAILLATLNNGATFNVSGSESTWKSANSKIATVSNGIITGISAGLTKITATFGGKSTVFNVNTALKALVGTDSSGTTIPESAKGTAIPELKLLPKASTTITLAATHVDNVKLAVTQGTTWSSSNTKVATVTSQGIINTISSGVSTITGTYDGKKVVAKVNTTLKSLVASYPDPTTPKVIFTLASGTKPAELKMKLSDVSVALAVYATYADDSTLNVAANSDMKWKTSNNKVATVNEKGVISTTGLPGVATITATYGGNTATIKVNTTITGLTSDKTEVKLKPSGATGAIVLTANYANGNSDAGNVTATSAVWKSSSTKIATVDASGVVTSVSSGTTNITATYGGKTVKIKVTTTFTLATDSSTSVIVGGNKTVTVTATYADGTTEDVTSKVTWASTKDTIASVSSGQITGVKAGTATIKATYLGVSKSITVTVS